MMQELSFFKLSPGGNTTILIDASNMTVLPTADTANSLMDPFHLQGEQVGYVELRKTPPQLTMMGGEFCLNATRCLSLLMLRNNCFFPLEDTDDLFGLVRSSGMPTPLHIRIQNGKHLRKASAAPCFLSLTFTRLNHIFVQEGPVLIVRLPGITHVLIKGSPPQQKDLIQEACLWREKFALQQEEACGVIWYDSTDLTASAPAVIPTLTMTPVVYVQGTQSAIAETSCGSGALALSLAYATGRLQHVLSQPQNTSPITLILMQPSEAALTARIIMTSINTCTVELGGMVELQAQGTAFIHSDTRPQPG